MLACHWLLRCRTQFVTLYLCHNFNTCTLNVCTFVLLMCVCARVPAHVCAYTCVPTCRCTCVCVCTCVLVHACVNVHMCVCVCDTHSQTLPQVLTHRHTYQYMHRHTHTHHTYYTQALVHTYTNVHTHNTYTLNYVLKHSYSSKYFLKGLGPRIKPGLGSKKNHHHYSFASPSYPDVRCKMRPWLRLGMDKTLIMLYPPRFRWDFGCL